MKNTKNMLYKVSGLILTVALITPLFASAQSDTSDLTSQIQSLVSQITSLETQLHALVKTAVASTTMPMGDMSDMNGPDMSSSTPGMMGGMRCPEINRDLSIGSSGSDVSALQGMLADEGFLSASSTTGFFGQLTAHALSEFQSRSGIASSTGFLGPLTRTFLRNRCGGGQGGGMMGSSTPPTGGSGGWGQGGGQASGSMGSSTPCMHPSPASGTSVSGGAQTTMRMMRPCGGMQWDQGSTTTGGGHWMAPMMGSSTPAQPCQGQGIQNGDNAAAVALALFVPHSLIPGMMHPCDPGVSDGAGASGEMQQ